jgi:RimJ/RimL family protein N-acetyltransferase
MKRVIIVGEKVYFRPIEREDIDRGWLDWVNDAEISSGLDTIPPVSRESLEKYYENSMMPDVRMFAVCCKENDEYIGNARLSSINWVRRIAAYGRMLGNSDYHGKGIGTEILVLLAKYAFLRLNLRRLYTGVVATNIASIKSSEKAGARQEGILRENVFSEGKYYDAVMMGLLRSDFEEKYGNK